MEGPFTPRERELIAHGIGAGLALGAGVAGECPEMNGRQIAVMLESLANSVTATKSAANRLIQDSLLDREPTLGEYREAIASLMRQVKGRGRG
jgi:hypothetical protein